MLIVGPVVRKTHHQESDRNGQEGNGDDDDSANENKIKLARRERLHIDLDKRKLDFPHQRRRSWSRI